MTDATTLLQRMEEHARLTEDGDVEMVICPVCEGPMPDDHLCCSMKCYREAVRIFATEDGTLH